MLHRIQRQRHDGFPNPVDKHFTSTGLVRIVTYHLDMQTYRIIVYYKLML